jgi:hypothetical protein
MSEKIIQKLFNIQLNHQIPKSKRDVDLLMNFSKVVDYDPRKIGKIDTTFNLNDKLPKGNDFDLYPITGSGELRMFNKNNVSIYSTKVYSKQTDPEIRREIRNNSIKYRNALIKEYKSKMENNPRPKIIIEEEEKVKYNEFTCTICLCRLLLQEHSSCQPH